MDVAHGLVADELEDAADRDKLDPIAQRDPIDFQHFVSKAGYLNDLAGWFTDGNRYA